MTDAMFTAAVSGFALGLQLIVAIGAQNAFLLRQGLRRSYVGPVVLVCAASDAVLIAVGVLAFAAVEARLPVLAPAMLWAGVAFLIWYGWGHARNALRGGATLSPDGAVRAESLRSIVLTCLALTWLNPHVYLDTVVLIGTVSAQFGTARMAFGGGAILASFCFFTALGYGARILSPIFGRAGAWRVLDAVIALTMWALALKLVLRAPL